MSDYISRKDAYVTLTAYYHHRTAIQHLGLKEALSRVPDAELGTNLAEVGTRAVRGYPIDADALMEKVAEEYGERARDTLYRIIRYMPPAQPEPCEDAVSRYEGEYR